MIARIIDWSVHNRPLVLLATLFLVAAGLLALKDTAVDAIPDLSDVQVIIRTPFAGQAPRVVGEQSPWAYDIVGAEPRRRTDWSTTTTTTRRTNSGWRRRGASRRRTRRR